MRTKETTSPAHVVGLLLYATGQIPLLSCLAQDPLPCSITISLFEFVEFFCGDAQHEFADVVEGLEPYLPSVIGARNTEEIANIIE
jgi:hypothetical protein